MQKVLLVKSWQNKQRQLKSCPVDQDQYQEMWLHYLSGHSINSIDSKLDQVIIDEKIYQLIKKQATMLNNEHFRKEFDELMSDFTEFEREIITLIFLGLNASDIAKYKNIDIVRLRQAIRAIKSSSAWDKEWLSRLDLQRKKSTVSRKKR